MKVKLLSRAESTPAPVTTEEGRGRTMERNRAAGLSGKMHGSRAGFQDLAAFSRRAALETIQGAVRTNGSGPVLLTGEPGAGKTWLWQRMVQDLPAPWHWVCVDVSPALDAVEFLRLIGHGLGIAVPDRLGAARVSLAGALLDEAHDGRSWLLVVENAQNASDEVWNEIRALANLMDRREGCAALLIVGLTEVVRQLSSRRLNSLAARMWAHVHLLPLELEETLELTQGLSDSSSFDPTVLEKLHRDARGNPRRLIQLLHERSAALKSNPTLKKASDPVRRLPDSEPPRDVAIAPHLPGLDHDALSTDGTPEAVNQKMSDPSVAMESGPTASPLVPTRPPLRVEEGLIEVGWSGSLEAEAAASSPDATSPAILPPLAQGELPSEEMIEDHYAALQAWTEWAQSRGRMSEAGLTTAEPSQPWTQGLKTESRDGWPESVGSSFPTEIRVEPQHEHAPYSQLFSRLRQSK
jgi:type II secretory pathway predicted ATPase ExeA